MLVLWGVLQKAQCDCFGGKISVSRRAGEETDVLRIIQMRTELGIA